MVGDYSLVYGGETQSIRRIFSNASLLGIENSTALLEPALFSHQRDSSRTIHKDIFMKTIDIQRAFRLGCIALLFICVAGQQASAIEPAEEFLAGLRERGYYENALEYLDKMKTSTLVSPDFKRNIEFERGVTLIEASRAERNMVERQKVLDEAKTALEQFVAGVDPGYHLVSSAQAQLANLLVERARMNIQKASQKNTVPALRDSLMKEARQWFTEAGQVFETSRSQLEVKLETIPKNLDMNNPSQRRLIKIRDQYRTDYLQARLLIPAIKEETADTYADDAPERKTNLTEAAELFGKVYEDYRTRIAGLYARMYQGRCQTKLKDYKEALSLFNDIFEQPDSPDAFRTLKMKTMVLAIDCWLPKEGQPLYNDGIQKMLPMIENVRQTEVRTAEWLYLRLALAKCYEVMGNDVSDTTEKRTALTNARKHASFVSKYPSDYKREAQELVARLGGLDLPPEEEEIPKTFAEARQKGKEALDEWQTGRLTVQKLTQQVAAETDQTKKAELQANLAAAQKLVKDAPGKSLGFFKLALELANDETTDEDINIARYFIAFWHFTLGNYYDAALVGEFVARRYPGSAASSQLAQIALAAYVQIYKTSKTEDQGFAKRRIVGIGDYSIQQWPEKPEAVAAANTLIAFMVQDKKLDEAIKYLNLIPEASPNRGEAELKTGQALWSSYLSDSKALRENPPSDAGADVTEEKRLDKIKEDAKKILSDGINRLKSAPVSETLLTATLSLAQIYVDTGEVDEAIAMLEDGATGALPFVKQNHPATQKKGFAIETYKTALRAYISSSASNSDAKAQEMTEGLNKSMTDQKQLVATYIKLASDMKGQIDRATDSKMKKSLASRFSIFLKNIRGQSDELSVQTWAADSFSKLGESFAASGSSTDAKKFFQEAVKGFDTILDKGKKTPKWLSPEVETQVRMRKASTQAGLGDYKEAIDTFETLLKAKSSNLTVQLAAARAYQAWGKKDSKKYYNAIMGGDTKDSQNKRLIWGWGKLSQITVRYDQFRDIFHESRYAYLYCRFHYAKKNSKDKKKDYKKVSDAIKAFEIVYKDLGGPNWKPKYEALMKEVDAALR